MNINSLNGFSLNFYKLIYTVLSLLVFGSLFLPWFSLSVYKASGNQIEELEMFNIFCPLMIIALIVSDGIKKPISSRIQFLISILTSIQIIYNIYILKQFEFNYSLIDLIKDFSEVIPIIDVKDFLEVNLEIGVYLFFIFLTLILILPFFNYFFSNKNLNRSDTNS
jgi:hypothetical protein